MTEFLTIINRVNRSQDSSRKGAEQNREILEESRARYSCFVGSDYVSKGIIKAANKRQDVHILQWLRRGTPDSLAISVDSWALSAGHEVSDKLLANMRLGGGTLKYVRPVWGHYAAVFGTNNLSQIFAWNTTPALEAIHWAVTPEHVIISNRPLLAAICLATLSGEAKPSLSHDYLAEYLLYGYSITGQTPFQGVRTLSVNSALSVINGQVSIVPTPAGLQSELDIDHSIEDGAEALAISLINAMDRTESELAGRPLQLRLSGGKDSRLLLALLRNRDIDFRAVTFGTEEDADVKLANYLCRMVGVQGEIRSPRPAEGKSISERIEASLLESGGIPASEPHTAQYVGADAERPGEAIMMGQWPLYKGGMARQLGLSSSRIVRTLNEQGGLLVNDEKRATFDANLLKWSDELPLSREIEKLYLFAREFRSGRYLHAHIAQYARSSMIAYPIADAEVGAVCDALSMEEKVSEKALFGALQEIWPEVMRVPLDRSRWRFEASGPDPELSGPWYEGRYSTIPNTKASKQTDVNRVVGEYSNAAALELAQYFLRSDYYEYLASHLTDDMLSAISRFSADGIVVPDKMSKRMFIKFLWRICVAEVWLSERWYRTSSV